MFQFKLDLVNYKEICDLTVEAGTLQVNKSINTTAVISFTVNSTVTHDGYFYINATLQKGVAGIMIQAQYINGSVLFNQSILRKPSSDYAGANNTTPLPNGTFYLAIYMLKSDGVSFDLSRPIRENIVITSVIKSPVGPEGPKHKLPIWAIILIVTGVAALICVVILGAAIFSCWRCNRQGALVIANRQLHEQAQENEPPQEDEPPREDEEVQEDEQAREDRQPQEDGEGPPAQVYAQPIQEDPQVKDQKCTDEQEFLSISIKYPVLTEPSLHPHSPSAFEQTKSFENLSSDARVYESASINSPSVTIREDNSVSFSSTAGSDRPLLPERAPTTSYQTTAAEEGKVNKPHKVRAGSEPFEIVHI